MLPLALQDILALISVLYFYTIKIKIIIIISDIHNYWHLCELVPCFCQQKPYEMTSLVFNLHTIRNQIEEFDVFSLNLHIMNVR